MTEELIRRTNERIEFATNTNNMSDIGYLESIKEALESSQWISVEDRLPDLHLCVLISDGQNVAKARRINSNMFEIAASNDPVMIEDLTHWQPLPAPPK